MLGIFLLQFSEVGQLHEGHYMHEAAHSLFTLAKNTLFSTIGIELLAHTYTERYTSLIIYIIDLISGSSCDCLEYVGTEAIPYAHKRDK